MVEPQAMTFGNLLRQDYGDFLQAFNGRFFRALPAPGPKTCSGCPHDKYCHGCFARTLRANERMVEERGEMHCHWRDKTGFENFVQPGS